MQSNTGFVVPAIQQAAFAVPELPLGAHMNTVTRAWGMLSFTYGSSEHKIYLVTDVITVGRSGECTVQCPDAGISNRHCTLIRRLTSGESIPVILDNRFSILIMLLSHLSSSFSLNGTYVNKIRLTKEQALTSGDIISIPRTEHGTFLSGFRQFTVVEELHLKFDAFSPICTSLLGYPPMV